MRPAPSSRASHTSHFAICKARSTRPRTAICKAQSTTKWGCALRVVKRRPLLYDSVVKDQIGSSLDHFPSAKHIFKASVACNGREMLRGFPKTPLAQRYAERARGADWEVSSFWFRVSSCWLPRNPKPETFNPQITHPSHTVGKQGVRSMNPFMKHLVIMRFTLNL